MSSIFGNTTNQQPPGTGLFGSSTQNQSQPAQGSGLFGSSTQNQPAQGSGLFGSNPAPTTNQAGSSVFGDNATNQTQTQSSGLFGAPAAANTGTSSLFGANPSTATNTGGSSLFGGNAANTNSNTGGSSLFGAPQTQNQGTNSLFSNPQQQQSAQQQQQQRSWAERTFTNPQPAALASVLQAGLGTSNTLNTLGSASQLDLARSRLTSVGVYAHPNEKTTMTQVQTLIRKWDPQSQDTLLQSYLYNAVNSAYAPFYYRNEDESENDWEAALAKKPENVEIAGGGGSVSFVPVLVRGFKALGERVEYQARTVNEMRGRLHEMNHSLDAVMKRHQQGLSTRLEKAKREHVALSQRCLRLAVKAQTLRLRGFPLSPAEEGLRMTMLELEQRVFDPGFVGREEEIWARMVALRERARWLEAEGKKLGLRVEEERKLGLPEEVVMKTKQILQDYDGQLAHLAKELESVKGEFAAWEGGQRR